MSSISFNPNAPFVKLASASTEEKIAFFDALPTNTTTTNLDINCAVLDADNAENLATALKVNTTLTSLSLINVGDPGEQATSSIVDALVINSTLISLKAELYPVSTLIAQKIGTMLEVNSSLQRLVLQNCRHIDDQNAIALTRTLGVNSTLASLDLSENSISEEGALEIGRVLSSNKTLTEMDFHCNRLGDKGASALIDAAILNPALTSLNIEDGELTLDLLPKIVGLIQATSSLRKLNIRYIFPTYANATIATILAGIRDAVLFNGTITSLYVIPMSSYITDTSRAIDDFGLRNEYNLGQKTISLFELLQDHLPKIAPEENFPIPQKPEPEKNHNNPHRSSYVDPYSLLDSLIDSNII